jgi:hypothetical protein
LVGRSEATGLGKRTNRIPERPNPDTMSSTHLRLHYHLDCSPCGVTGLANTYEQIAAACTAPPTPSPNKSPVSPVARGALEGRAGHPQVVRGPDSNADQRRENSRAAVEAESTGVFPRLGTAGPALARERSQWRGHSGGLAGEPGSGGQFIAFVPSLDLVVTRQTGSSGDWAFEDYLRRACAAVTSAK